MQLCLSVPVPEIIGLLLLDNIQFRSVSVFPEETSISEEVDEVWASVQKLKLLPVPVPPNENNLSVPVSMVE